MRANLTGAGRTLYPARMSNFRPLVAAGVARISRQPLVAYGLWIVVLLKLLTPPLVTLPVVTRGSPAPASGVTTWTASEPTIRASTIETAPFLPDATSTVLQAPTERSPEAAPRILARDWRREIVQTTDFLEPEFSPRVLAEER